MGVANGSAQLQNSPTHLYLCLWLAVSDSRAAVVLTQFAFICQPWQLVGSQKLLVCCVVYDSSVLDPADGTLDNHSVIFNHARVAPRFNSERAQVPKLLAFYAISQSLS